MCDGGDEVISDKIALAVIEKYNELPAKGKPQGKEHTILSGIVREHEGALEVISLGSGSGCLHCEKLSPSGTAISDGHAEVMTRRGFIYYLYIQLSNWLKGASDHPFYTDLTDGKLRLKGNFHLYISQPPCGDGCLGTSVPKDESEVPSGIKRQKVDTPIEKVKNSSTGARVVLRHSQKDLHPDCELVSPPNTIDTYIYKDHGDGQQNCVRNKPGRGTLSVSMSCSDKICRWMTVGIEGQLLSSFVSKCTFKTLVVGKCTNTRQLSATFERIQSITQSPLQVLPTTVEFEHSAPQMKAHERTMCGYSTSFSRTGVSGSLGMVHVITAGNGHTAGAGKKCIAAGRATSALSKLKFAQRFVSLLSEASRSEIVKSNPLLDNTISSITQRILSSATSSAVSYQTLKKAACSPTTSKATVTFMSTPPFTNWVQKNPSLTSFEIDIQALVPN